MKTIFLYECEVCRRRYDTYQQAKLCESRQPAIIYPTGLIYGDNRPGAYYQDIVFAIAQNFIDGHCNWASSWACGSNGDNDLLGDQQCGSDLNVRLTVNDAYVNRDSDEFKRLVNWLRRTGITPTLWDGEKPVPI